ncbi:MAG: DUF5615 family PIN-like protein [Bifidobacteriaceae bacterium]|jgi:predicted nuclease of predicted toxin-antitoxin system|nr:DUF5615 family PIN-like protein [Bifidobacteriaceae bacterium]
MTSGEHLRLLLDEHYPPALARKLVEDGIDAVALVEGRPNLVGASDADVLRAAASEARVVVTEDVSTFSAAIREVPDHVGVVFCRSGVFRRTPAGLGTIRRALLDLATNPPIGLGVEP